MSDSPFNYSGNPSDSVVDWIRFEIQDTDPKAWLLTDGEIAFCVSQEAPEEEPTLAEGLGAAARCMEALARRFAAQADTEIGSLKTTYSKSAAIYSKRAVELRERAAGGHGAPIFTAQTHTQKRTAAENTDRVQPKFTRGQFTNPMTGPVSTRNPPFNPGEDAPL